MRLLLLGAAALAGLAAAARADEAAMPRFLEFRDGSVLRLMVVDEEWKINVVRPDGQVEPAVVRLSALEKLTLMPEPVFERKRVLFEIIKRLGADRFPEREEAQEKLLKMGSAVRPELEAALEVFTDLEVRVRLERILTKLPPPSGGPPARPGGAFDYFVGRETLRGDAGEGSLAVKIDGQTRRLSRKDIRTMSVRVPEPTAPEPAGLRRLEPRDFPPGCMEESFETAPTGRRLVIGENIEKLFVSKGFTLSTSVRTSYVSVNDFTVQGKSRGLSAATHQPLFQGEITIRFCRPGNEHAPAGVSHFGLWIAHVMPRGTAMAAYDLQGRELGRIETTRDGHEFLGVQSSVPIHSIKIIPNLQIDPDFTLDDFIYLMPRAIEAAHPEKFLAQFEDGERVFCDDVSFGPQEVRLHGLPAGLPDRIRPTAALVRVAAPDRGRSERGPPAGVFVELRDGSVIFGSDPGRPGAPVFARRPQVLREKDNIVGLWSSELPRTVWPSKVALPAVWDVEKKTWQPISDVTFQEEAVAWTVAGKRRARSYFEMAPLLLRPPTSEPSVGSWRLRTALGEEIVLGNGVPVLRGTLSRGLEAIWGDGTLKVPAAELVSVFRVVKEE
ncbi:MAG TPA: hypothetical protein VNK04_00990 [Gemmataceae bacterium]|nr:hypothetical protein [Gemmataceae bacterium]